MNPSTYCSQFVVMILLYELSDGVDHTCMPWSTLQKLPKLCLNL